MGGISGFEFTGTPFIFAQYKIEEMPKKLKPTGKQKSLFFLHCVVFAIATILSFMFYDYGVKGWAYPWHAWTVAAWGLFVLGHGCIVFASTEDHGYEVYRQQQGKS